MEEQQDLAGAEVEEDRPVANGEVRRSTAYLERERRRRDLELKHELILNARTSSSARRSALEAALAEIEAQLESLDLETEMLAPAGV